MAFVVITAALFLEYAFSKGGVLRWLMHATGQAPAAQRIAEPAPAPEPERAPSVPASPRRATAPQPKAPAPAARPAPAAPVATQPGSLPMASSFESEPLDWVFDARGGDGLGARSRDDALGGEYSLFSQASEAANRGWPGWIGTRRYAVTQGQAYLFRAHAASPNGANAWLDIGLYDRQGNWLGGRSTGCSRERPGRRWQEMQLRYVVDDPRVETVRLALLQCLNHSTGRMATLYFDDVSFGPAP